MQVERDLVMKMRRRGDGDRVDALRDQLIETGECPAADQLGRAGAMRRQGIDNPDQFDAGQASQHAGMIAAHDAGADDADAKRALRAPAPTADPFELISSNPDKLVTKAAPTPRHGVS